MIITVINSEQTGKLKDGSKQVDQKKLPEVDEAGTGEEHSRSKLYAEPFKETPGTWLQKNWKIGTGIVAILAPIIASYFNVTGNQDKIIFKLDDAAKDITSIHESLRDMNVDYATFDSNIQNMMIQSENHSTNFIQIHEKINDLKVEVLKNGFEINIVKEKIKMLNENKP